jgi:hypothetical protein
VGVCRPVRLPARVGRPRAAPCGGSWRVAGFFVGTSLYPRKTRAHPARDPSDGNPRPSSRRTTAGPPAPASARPIVTEDCCSGRAGPGPLTRRRNASSGPGPALPSLVLRHRPEDALARGGRTSCGPPEGRGSGPRSGDWAGARSFLRAQGRALKKPRRPKGTLARSARAGTSKSALRGQARPASNLKVLRAGAPRTLARSARAGTSKSALRGQARPASNLQAVRVCAARGRERRRPAIRGQARPASKPASLRASYAHSVRAGSAQALALRFGFSIVPVQLRLPQRQAQIFFRRAVCGSSREMP